MGKSLHSQIYVDRVYPANFDPFSLEVRRAHLASLSLPLDKRPGFHKVVGRLPWLRNNSSVQRPARLDLVKHSIGQGAYAKIYQVFQTNNTDSNPSRSVLKVHDLNAIWEFSITSELLRTAPTKRKLSCCMSRTFLIEEYLNQLDDWIAIDKINP